MRNKIVIVVLLIAFAALAIQQRLSRTEEVVGTNPAPVEQKAEQPTLAPGESVTLVDPKQPIILKDAEGNPAVEVKEFKITALPSTPETEGGASWYDYSLPGHPNYSKDNDTCAVRDWPRGTKLLIRYQDKTVICRVNDYFPPHPTRIVDLSSHAFKTLAPLSKGVIQVVVQPLE